MNRKDFLKTASAAGLGAIALPKFSLGAGLGGEKIKVAFVGCGGRARGAIQNMTAADENIQIVALADIFEKQIEDFTKSAREYVSKSKRDKADAFWKDYWKVTPETTFIGLDSIDKVLKTDAQVIALVTPPCFRTSQIEKCLKAGKHVFAEKPIAIDAVQLRKIYDELIPLADKKGLKVLCGTQMRYHKWIAEAVDKIRGGDIGDILATNCFRYEGYYLTRGTFRAIPNSDMSPDDVKYQLINWLGFIWTSGDQVVEQYVHNLDMALWALGELPYESIGSGGRSTNLKFPEEGDRFSNIHAYLTFKNGFTMNAECRQDNGTSPFSALHIYGTKGMASLTFGKQYFYDTKGNQVWTSSGDRKPELVCEHEALFGAIRNGTPFNTLKACADSCYVAVAIRETSYAGKRVKCEYFRQKSTQSLVPETLSLDGKKALTPVPNPVDYKIL